MREKYHVTKLRCRGIYWGKGNEKMGREKVRPAPRDRSARREERQTDRDREIERELGGRQGPFTRERSEGAQVVLLVASVKDVDPKVRLVQMPEY